MLQTCSRCRSRRIKCDSRLPACTNCARNDLECTFHDDALQEDIPRSYIQSLNKRIEDLTSQLAIHQPKPVPFGILPPQRISDPLESSLSYQPLDILVPARPGSDLHLDLSVSSRMTRVFFEIVPSSQISPEVDRELSEDDYTVKPTVSSADKSQLAPSTVRFLLRRYDRCIRPRYDVRVPELTDNDGAKFKKLPDTQKFKLLMACAIAAAHEAYKSPDWRPVTQVCRNWANELVTPIISAGDGDTLAAILLLLIYELADPCRGIVWELFDLAARTCLQLGWYQVPHGSISGHLITSDNGDVDQTGNSSSDKVQLMSVLKDIEGSLRTIFNRPNMLSNFKLPSTSNMEPLLDLYSQISDQIYGAGGVYDSLSCPFAGEVSSLMDVLESLQGPLPVIQEMWLLFLPICAKHKQCLHCFQEPDEPNAKGMTELRRNVITAASDLIASVHREVSSIDNFTPPVIASSRAFIAGCSIATGMLRQWTSPKAHVRDLINCAEILTTFAPHWSGGHTYLKVWKTIIGLLDLNPLTGT
ncbi:GAL4-like domain-containing transcription factor [Aspergillus stella-maris]|uniref:GAL4-like domain-containing transcription factor n=1 Tax=Aspergillus stella-maris TaxID=1810926 RepID=UPI003CCD81D3